MKPLRVEFDMTPEDAAAGAEAYATRDPAPGKVRAKARRVVVAVVLFLAACLAFDLTYHSPRVDSACMGCVIGAMFVLLLFFPDREVWRRATLSQVAAALATPAGKATLGPRSVEVGDDGIAIASGFARTLITWRGLINVIPTATHLVVVLPGPVCLAVPRRAFADDHDFEHFGEVVTDLATANGGLTGRAAPP